jgi:diguanylate cyclase (GGDEF)-like protein/PAS domain S-box-containing protein
MNNQPPTVPAGQPAARVQEMHGAWLRLLQLLSVPKTEDELLRQGIEALASLIGARYAALALLDDEGGMRQFVYTGIPPGVAARVGRLPEGKGLLGVVIQEHQPLRLDDLTKDPRSVGLPPHHPPMQSLLAAPVSYNGEVYGRVYLSEKTDGSPFTAEDERLVVRFAEALAVTLRLHRAEAERRRAEAAQVRSEKMLVEVAHALSAVTGEEFFPRLVLDLTRALGLRYAFIGETVGESLDAVQTLAVCVGGRIVDNFRYTLAGTPCRHVVGRAPCQYPNNIQQQFPEDHLLQQMGIESYVGFPLFGSRNQPVGLLVAMDDKPMADPQTIESVLQICATRTAAELERRQYETALREIAKTLSGNIGSAFFSELVLTLARVLGVEYAFIGELSPRQPDIIQTVAFCDHGQIADNIEYQLAPETVCGSVGCKAVCTFPEGARKLYPEDEVLGEFRVEAFVGHPLTDSAGRLLGLLVVMHGRPLSDLSKVQALLEICAMRAASELERIRSDSERQKLSGAIEQTADSVMITDRRGIIEYVNPAFEATTGYTRAEALGRQPNLVKSGEHEPEFYHRLWETIRRGDPFRAVFVNRRKDGRLYHEEKTITPLRNARGEIMQYVSTGKDISERMQAAEALREQEERFRQLAENISQVFWMTTVDKNQMLYVSPAFEKIWGIPCQRLYGQPRAWLEAIHPDDRERVLEAALHRQADSSYREEYRIVRPDGSIRWILDRAFPVRDAGGRVYRIAGIAEDITEQQQTQKRLKYLAFYDPLTGLPNRALMLERLRQTMADAERVNRLAAVMFLDLDRFKVINDTLGHHTGDALLKSVAARLESCLRPGDIIARLGGDEFTVVLANVALVDDVARLARKIIDSFAQPFRVEERDLFTTTSIGIALFPFDVQDAESLLKNADAAMYHAKEMGRNTFQFFTAELNVRADRRLRLETALRQALDRGELGVHYQPQVDLKTGQITGLEALVRWTHPDLGQVSPLEFIPIAEETGLILPIGEWVLREACRQVKAWHEMKSLLPRLQVAVNISGKQLRQSHFPDLVVQVLAETGLEARYLDLELTESLLMENVEEIAKVMHRLHDLGVSFSVDDFGTGYSSLAYLKRFPLDILKIDRTFVRDLATDANDIAIVKTIIAMAHTLGMRVVAEGVETKEQLEFLRREGCDGSQGYYCSMPLSAVELSELIDVWDKRHKVRCQHQPEPPPAGVRRRGARTRKSPTPGKRKK